MRSPFAKPLVSILAGACIVVLLAACAQQSAPQRSSEPIAASPSAKPRASATPAQPADTLFTIAAKVRNSEGTTIGIQLIAHSPIAANDYDKASEAVSAYLKQCGMSVDGTAITQESMIAKGSILVPLDLTSTAAGDTFSSPLDLFLGSGFNATAMDGDGITPPPVGNGCIGTYSWSHASTAHGLAEFENGKTTPDTTGWRYGRYGFAVQAGTGDTIDSCTITMTPLATSAGIDEVPGWVTRDTSGTTCATGYSGE